VQRVAPAGQKTSKLHYYILYSIVYTIVYIVYTELKYRPFALRNATGKKVTQNKPQKLKPDLVSSYDIPPGNREAYVLISALHTFITSRTYLDTLAPGTHTGLA